MATTKEGNTKLERLPGRGRTSSVFAVRSAIHSLWFAKDHLLAVSSTGFNESYKRLYFRDIQAITMYRTRTLQWAIFLAGTLAAFAIITGVIWQVKGTYGYGYFVMYGLGGILLAWLTPQLFKGPTCLCYLRTAVQTVPLYSLSTVRRANRVLPLIQDRIEAAQQDLKTNQAAPPPSLTDEQPEAVS